MFCKDMLDFHSSVYPRDMPEAIYDAWKIGKLPIPGCGDSISLRDLIYGIQESMHSAKNPDILRVVSLGLASDEEKEDGSPWCQKNIKIERLCYHNSIPFDVVANSHRIYCCAWKNDYSEVNPPDIRCIYLFDVLNLPKFESCVDVTIETLVRTIFKADDRPYTKDEIESVVLLGAFEASKTPRL